MLRVHYLVRPLRLISDSTRVHLRILSQSSQIFSQSPAWRCSLRSFSNAVPEKSDDEHPSIIQNLEKSCGPKLQKGFQAETNKLLDIVAKSLYSSKEVFIRELISNSSDAIERLRFMRNTGKYSTGDAKQTSEIHLKTDEQNRLLIIQDTGIGMTKEEMECNLGTIAKSGSREFVSKLNDTEQNIATKGDIIGQFGVGFYASFMVADKVEVFSRSQLQGNEVLGHYWCSSGIDGTYELSEAEQVKPGTKIVLHLKETCSEFAKAESVEQILQKYSNFVSTPIYLNGRRINLMEPIWLKESHQVTEEEHTSFYQFLASNTYDSPRYTLMYRADAPINLRVLLYVPNYKPSIFDVARDSDSGVSLYSRKVLIMNRSEALLPKWLRFLKGVVDSEDIPLNLSRELLQDNALIRRINRLLTSRTIRFLSQQASRDAEKFASFLSDFGLYLKEGIILEADQKLREEIARLLRWESSALPVGQTTSLEEYATRMQAGDRKIYFLSAPSRQLAESSPYFEALKKKNPLTEVLFLYEPYDELVLMQLNQFDKKSLYSIENLVAEDASDSDTVGPSRENCLSQDEANELAKWAQTSLGEKVKKVKVTQRLSSHPCFVSIREAGAMRHFLRTSLADRPAEERFRVLEPVLELNPEHVLVRHLARLVLHKPTDDRSPQLTEQIANDLLGHLFDTALAQAGLLDDVRGLSLRMNELVTKLIEKQHPTGGVEGEAQKNNGNSC